MKTRYYFFMAAVLSGTNIFSQVKTVKPLTEKTVVAVPIEKKMANPQPVKNQPAPAPPISLQTATISISTGDDGKDNNTIVNIDLLDFNKRSASNYSDAQKTPTGFVGRPNDEYFTGSSVTLPMAVQASVPTGEVKLSGSLPLPVLRDATPADFNPTGEIKISINPDGHDTWKITTLTVTLSFLNDGGSPHRITWSNITLSQDSRTRELLFDKNFNPVQ